MPINLKYLSGRFPARRPGRSAGAALGALGVVLLLAAESLPAAAVPAAPRQAASQEPAPEVYHLVFGPGDRVWEKFGHNAILIRNPATGRERVYNWGVFDFDQEDFFLRLLTGRMLYTLEASPLDANIRAYRAANRDIRIQRLRLTDRQARELERRAEVNLRPEHRDYAYDPYLDNCATRIRDHLDAVLGGSLRAATDTHLTEHTFRDHTRRLLSGVTWAYAGTLGLLGRGVDRRITPWEEMFLPLRMEARLRDVRVEGPDGDSVSLVAWEDTVFRADRPPAPAEVPAFHLPWLALGLAGGVVLGGLGMAAGRRRRGPVLHAFGVVATGWHLVAGLLGVLFAFVWAFSGHWYAHQNENLLLLNPLSLALAALVPVSVRAERQGDEAEGRGETAGRTGVRAARWAMWTAAVLAGLAALALLLKPLPGLEQVNGELIALLLPLHLGAAVGSWGVWRGG